MSVGLEIQGVPVFTSWLAPRGSLVVMKDPATQSKSIAIHPFMWMQVKYGHLEALDQIMRVLVKRAQNAMDRIELGSELPDSEDERTDSGVPARTLRVLPTQGEPPVYSPHRPTVGQGSERVQAGTLRALVGRWRVPLPGARHRPRDSRQWGGRPMSRCISSHGEYGSHELADDHRCEWCRVWECPVCGECEPYPLDGDDHDCSAPVVPDSGHTKPERDTR